jgi:hypothetical protein
LQGDADNHLAQGGARDRVRTAQSLRAQQRVNPKRASLPDNPVQQKRGGLRDLVILHEELLELVNDQQHARQRHLPAGALVTGQVLHAELAEKVAAPAQFIVEPLQDAQAELPVTLDRDHARVGQAMSGITLELNPLFKID